ncbi:uncharacterized protein N7459_005566 [Penicillium hispanicum]|uniref:uncharacterized protein n=1 Tax=Penicillium hispanicum TaxID=1080232 RepID=UPI0025426013|nr:uncharacterized protein N7459_005566 [Penicillium hispanicum]KAJ5579581.1 hypothetical protein N7459_005566 [Penicillium hispanicum]
MAPGHRVGNVQLCYRLKRTCLPGNGIRAQKARKNNPNARIAQLEGKLDGLVSLLEATQKVDGSTDSLSPSSSTTPFSRETAGIPPSLASSLLALETSPEACLAYFRDHMLKYFPFLYPPTDVQWLRRERPFLFICIMAAASQSTQTKVALSEHIKQTITQRVFFDRDASTVNIDLLLGLLTFLAWGHDHLIQQAPARVSRYTQLAMTLVFDLRLNKPAADDSNMLPKHMNESFIKTPRCSLEERRALLGCYVMSSMYAPPTMVDRLLLEIGKGLADIVRVSLYFLQIDELQWTPFMDECLDVLSRHGESPYDEVFAHQVRLQRIASELQNIKGAQQVPPGFYLTALKQKLDDTKSRIPQAQQKGTSINARNLPDALLATLHYTDLSAFGLILSSNNIPDFQRVEYLYASLNTVKSAIDSVFTIPSIEYVGISFPYFTQLARYIAVLLRLSTINDPTWDTNLARSTIDVLQVMDRLIDVMQQARAAADESCKDGFLDRAMKVFTATKSWCSTKLAETEGNYAPDNSIGQTFEGNGIPLDMLFMEDLWLREGFALQSADINIS